MSDQQHTPDPSHQLQRDIHYQVVDTLRRSMPPPPDASPESVARSHRVAIAKVASMVPVSAQEADLAASAVAAGTHAADALQAAVQFASDPHRVGQLRAQAASMGREARGYCTALLRMQAARQKREATDETRDAASWAEHCWLGLMTQALDSMPALTPPTPAAAPEPPPVAAVEPQPAAVEPAAASEPPAEAQEPPPPAISPEEAARRRRLNREAEHYAIVNTTNARRIREARGIPADCDFEPPRKELLDAIVEGTGPNLRWSDTYVPHPDVIEARRRQAEREQAGAVT